MNETYIKTDVDKHFKKVKLQNLVANCCKMQKTYSVMKFANFVYYCIGYLYGARDKPTKFLLR